MCSNLINMESEDKKRIDVLYSKLEVSKLLFKWTNEMRVRYNNNNDECTNYYVSTKKRF